MHVTMSRSLDEARNGQYSSVPSCAGFGAKVTMETREARAHSSALPKCVITISWKQTTVLWWMNLAMFVNWYNLHFQSVFQLSHNCKFIRQSPPWSLSTRQKIRVIHFFTCLVLGSLIYKKQCVPYVNFYFKLILYSSSYMLFLHKQYVHELRFIIN